MSRPAAVLRPPIRYVGGKGRQLGWVLAHIPPLPRYLEACGGSGWVLLNRAPAALETYNDVNGDLANLYRVLRDAAACRELEELCQLTLYCRQTHREARRLLAGGDGSPVERRDAVDIIHAMDNELTAIYADPPYVPHTRAKGAMYASETDAAWHGRLVDALLGVRHASVTLSGYASPMYAPLEAAGWLRVERAAYSSVARKSTSRRVECLWLNPRCRRLLAARALFD